MAKQWTRTVGMGTANLMGVAVSWCPVASTVSDVLPLGGGKSWSNSQKSIENKAVLWHFATNKDLVPRNILSRKICGKPTRSAHKGASRFLVGWMRLCLWARTLSL